MPRPYFSLDAPDSGSATPVEQIDWLARFAEERAERQRHREERRRAQAEFAEARRHGLAARHATKLARIHAARALRAARGPAVRGPAVRGPAVHGPAVRGPAVRGPVPCAGWDVGTHDPASAVGGSPCEERVTTSTAPAEPPTTDAAGTSAGCPQSTVALPEAGLTAAPAPAAAEPESTTSMEPTAPECMAVAGSPAPGLMVALVEPAAPGLMEAVGSALPGLVAVKSPVPEPVPVVESAVPEPASVVESAAPEPVVEPAASEPASVVESPAAERVSAAASTAGGRRVGQVLCRHRAGRRCARRMATPAHRDARRWWSVIRRMAGGRSPPACTGAL